MIIHVNLNLSNPFSHRFDTIFYKDRMFFKHKGGEIQVVKDNSIIGFNLDISARCDHAGISVDLSLLGHTLYLKFYDRRHWDTESNQWTKYD